VIIADVCLIAFACAERLERRNRLKDAILVVDVFFSF
jgi:hypothetical protein